MMNLELEIRRCFPLKTLIQGAVYLSGSLPRLINGEKKECCARFKKGFVKLCKHSNDSIKVFLLTALFSTSIAYFVSSLFVFRVLRYSRFHPARRQPTHCEGFFLISKILC